MPECRDPNQLRPSPVAMPQNHAESSCVSLEGGHQKYVFACVAQLYRNTCYVHCAFDKNDTLIEWSITLSCMREDAVVFMRILHVL